MQLRWPLMLAVLGLTFASGCGSREQPPVSAEVKPALSSDNQLAVGELSFVRGYQRGYEQALASGKPMMVFFTANWCQLGSQMASDAFSDKSVVALSEQFVCILVDVDAEPDVRRQHNVQGCPAIQFLSPKGVPLNRSVGKKPASQVVLEMQQALQNIALRAETRANETILR